MATIVFILIVLALFIVFLYTTFWRDKWIRNRTFPSEWQALLESSLPVYSVLSREEQSRLRQLILLFLAKKRFYGCGGLEITDEIRVTVAAQACLLLLNQGWNVYPKLLSVLIYPSAFRAERELMQEDGTVAKMGHDLLGESWSNGKVILSWDDVSRGVADFTDGQNVVLHEFAHQLDGQSGYTNGAPALRRNSYKSWSKVFSQNFDDLKSRTQHRQATVIDKYGTTNPAEFFAVATETFFEKPHDLYKRRPDLYEELRRYYQVDPREWH
ncbi:MAG: M90 family metallopeptidase [Halioglobus sp.]